MENSTTFYVFILVILLLNAVILWQLFRRGKGSQTDSTGFLLIQNQFNDLTGNLNKLTESLNEKMMLSSDKLNKSFQDQSGKSMEIIRDVTEKLTKLDETNKQVISFSEQLQSLQDILKNPKQRGILGEYYLETLLKNVMAPGQYQMQHAFKNGEIVDAVVIVRDKIIPVDSKFSLENYNRMIEATDAVEKDKLEKLFVSDLKLRITETSKYIRPEEGTTDFAFMFIPHEAIYYDLLINKIGAVTDDTDNLIQRAAGKHKVIIVSPTSFLAYLQTVIQGLKTMQIEEKTKEIQKNISNLMTHLKNYEEYHTKLGNSLGTTVSHFNSSRKEFGKVDKDVMRITGETIELDPLQLEKPDSE